ncbi:MAG: Thymidylate kinase (EC [uncultured Sulfurovum sp.]|uniref:Thymidylate kinase (EC) n=1 Tax=uncultured Sulfurovum sp. TaxID=269237 RepID=A0A6S6SNZ3_9BACT|nr:MAG: Thymidylate kinase (EC [uncultured Sulfurovum sp.]
MFKLVFIVWFGFTALMANNLLMHESSPYLKRHAHNPVDWHAWNKETLAKAKKLNRPIFLSIGYSTCHWCHVMEEESFEHKEVAEVLNKHFISIKVDKEQFPHIDKKYQTLFRAFKGKRGGWPLSAFLTPELDVYYMTAYIPRNGYGKVEGIIELSKRLGKLYKEKDKLKVALDTFSKAKANIYKTYESSPKNIALQEVMNQTVEKIAKQYDPENAGFDLGRTKFPEASKIELLLNIYKTTGDRKAFSMAEETLVNMSTRGIYDHIEGGFFRYSGKNWRIPHFQKFLYANAQMSLVYLEMYRLTGKKKFYTIAKDTVDLMECKYLENGHYYSASDSVGKSGVEGEYYTYNYTEIFDKLEKDGLEEEEIDEALEYFAIEMDGNIDGEFSHVNIMTEFAPSKAEIIKKYLKELRTPRELPYMDKKIITAWNAMMIKTLFVMAQYDESYLKTANERLASLLDLMLKNNTLYHQTVGTNEPKQKAQLEDYAYLIDALITAHQVTLDNKHLTLASRLAYQAKELFLEKGIWYMNEGEHRVRADFDDRYYTSALSVLLNTFLTLANIHDDMDLGEESKRMLGSHAHILKNRLEESSNFVTLMMREKLGVVTLKAPESDLHKYIKEFMHIDHPFVLRKAHQYDEYIACKLGVCLASAKNIKDISDDIAKMKIESQQKPKKVMWGK